MNLWQKVKKDFPQKMLLLAALGITCITLFLMSEDINDRFNQPQVSIFQVQFESDTLNKGYSILTDLDPSIEIIYEDNLTKIIRVKTQNKKQFLRRLLNTAGIKDAQIE